MRLVFMLGSSLSLAPPGMLGMMAHAWFGLSQSWAIDQGTDVKDPERLMCSATGWPQGQNLKLTRST